MIRNVTLKDAAAITAIYNFYINNSVATLEEKEVSVSYFETEIKNRKQDFPWFVYEKDNQIIGFANASLWKSRSGYKKSVQLTVYLKPDAVAKGVGSLFYKKMIDQLKKLDINAIIGGVSLPNNPSVALHEKFGFKKVAHFKKIGFKFNKWVDVGYWQLNLK